ncbi:hypothetical protein B0H66DRAFT_372723 [Apodospora peruviana]|uniref:FAD-binding domain-containing protein n=1 Tax=Apodospora peruviana TaxID=516989 RepID=A0AAE0LZZ8_9PEZI|nr:hypothetical protein B0H66DRAFT_372723 [Apodospora peruviana]
MSGKTAPHVLIIGAGIGGLTLAQGLRKQGITFDIFERDTSTTSRGQGYCIGLFDLDTLFGGTLPDDLPDLRTTCHLQPLDLPSQAIFHAGPAKFMVEDSPETPCVRANRLRLRELLCTGLNVQWGKQAERIEEDDEKVTVFFQDGSSATGDVLVGVDGAHSLVRPHVLKKSNDEVLNMSPNTIVVGETKLRGADFAQQLQLGHSCFMAFGKDFRLFSGLNRATDDGKEGEYYWLMSASDETVTQPDHWLKTASAEKKLEWATEKVQGLQPLFRTTIEKTKPEAVKATAMWWDALIPETPPVNRVIVIGDAAHPMTPAQGEGAIFAIKDAVALSKVLAEADKTDVAALKTKLNDFQQDIVAKGHEAIMQGRAFLAQAGKPQPGAKPKPPKAWGYETKMIFELKPLPITIAED